MCSRLAPLLCAGGENSSAALALRQAQGEGEIKILILSLSKDESTALTTRPPRVPERPCGRAADRAARSPFKCFSPVVFVPTAPAIVEFTGHPPKVGPPSALLTFAAANAGRNAFRKEAGPRATRAGALACMHSRAFCYGRNALMKWRIMALLPFQYLRRGK